MSEKKAERFPIAILADVIDDDTSEKCYFILMGNSESEIEDELYKKLCDYFDRFSYYFYTIDTDCLDDIDFTECYTTLTGTETEVVEIDADLFNALMECSQKEL
jgi:hypothetical protein